MASQLLNALSSGFTSKQIIDYLIRKFPNHKDKIKDALKAGFTVDQIVKFLGGGRKSVNEDSPATTEHEQTRDIDIQRGQDVNQTALKGAGMAALSGGAALGAPMLQNALKRAAPQLMGPGAVTNVQPGTLTTATGTMAPMPNPSTLIPSSQTQPSQPPISPNIAQQQIPIQPEIKPIDVKQILSKHAGFESKINDLMKSGNGVEEISTYFKKFNPSQTSKLEKDAGKSIEEIVSEYMGSIPEQENIPETQEVSKQKIPLTREEALGKFRENIINKGSTVASPQGIGSVREIRNGKAIIEVDGKKHQVNEDELIQAPIDEKDLADLYEELTQGIEKKTGKQISRNVEWAGYDPNTNELAYKPHGSDQLYAYDDISPEDVEVLTNFLTQRKSTGENFIGAWEAGTESPIGAAMYQLIKKLQSERGGKGNEYKNKFMTIYDALEPAKKALKERYAERKKKAKKPRID